MPILDTGPLALDWRIYAGDKNHADFEIIAEDPYDITGATITAQARTTAPDPEVALVATVLMGEATLGRFALEWDGEAARALLAGAPEWRGTWDVQIALVGDTLPRTLLRGAFIVVHDVTRDEGVPG